jgi:hypothetical protein
MKHNTHQLSVAVLCGMLLLGSLVGISISKYFSSNKPELLDSMSSTSKNQLLRETDQLNQLIGNLKKVKSDDSDKSERQKISKLYLSLANTLTSDLTTIGLQNPQMAPGARVTIDNLRNLSTMVMKKDFYPDSFRPERIRYQP